MNALTIIFAVAFVFTLILLIRSLFRQAGIQDTLQETSDSAHGQTKLWEEFGQHLDEGVALLDETGQIIYVNQAFARITGWINRSAFHQSIDTVLVLQDDSAKPTGLSKELSPAIQYVIGRDGTRTPARTIKRPLHQPEGYSVVVIRDASSQLAEQELRHRLVNLSSFELRTPITAMKGYASMLLDGDAGKLPKPVAEAVGPILQSTEQLATIVDDLAHVEVLGSDQGATKKHPMKVDEFLQHTLPQLKEVAKKAGHRLAAGDCDLAIAIPLDGQQIGRLLAMLTNAAARSAKPGSTVTLRCSAAPATIDFAVENEGETLPKQSQADVFDYGQAHGFEGGIGFYVAKQIIEAHHALVTVNTKPDGNVFILSLPKPADAEQPAKAPAPPAGKTDPEKPAASKAGASVDALSKK